MRVIDTAGLDTLVFEHRCKICQLSQTHPELFKELHELVLVQSWYANRAMNVVNNKITEQNLPLAKLNSVNMSLHFKNHVQIDERVARAAIEREKAKERNALEATLGYKRPRLADVSPDAASALSQMIEQKVGSEIEDYSNLTDLIENIRSKMGILEEHIEIDVSIGPDGKPQLDASGQPVSKRGVSLETMQLYTKLITEVRNCIVDLNKIRRSGSIMVMAMRSLAEKFTRASVQEMLPKIEEIAVMFRKHNIPESEIMSIMEAFKMDVINVLIDKSRTAVDEVMSDFKLKEDKL